MRLITSFLIILAFPWVFRLGNTESLNNEFCVTGMGYCIDYDGAIFAEPLRDSDNYGGTITSHNGEISGQFTAKVDPMKQTFQQQYLAIMSELEKDYPNLEQLNSMIADDFYYLSVQIGDELRYYQAWRENNRLVQLELSAQAGIERAIWEEAIGDFNVSWR